MPQTTLARNIDILLKVANGADHQALSDEHGFTNKANISGCVRDAIQAIRRYSGEELPITSSYEILSPMKEKLALIVKNTVIPKVSIPHQAHRYLSQQYGEDYPTKAKVVSKEWEEVTGKKLSPWTNKSVRDGIKRWLASEGYFVDNYIDDEHFDTVQNAIEEALNNYKGQGVDLSFERSNYSRHGMIRFTTKTGDATATRKIRLNLL